MRHAVRLRFALASGCLLLLSACGGGGSGSSTSDVEGITSGDYSSISGDVIIDGSSTVFPIAEAAAEEFGAVSQANVRVGLSGTGGGFEKFCRGETDISNASRPIKREELQLCSDNGVEMTEFRIAIDALTIALNPENTWATCLKFSQLRRIYDVGSTVTSWNQVDPSFPDEPLLLFSPGADSGTFDYFTEEVNGVLDQIRSDGVTFSEDDNVLVLGVSENRGAIGYFGYAYYKESAGKVKAAQVERDEAKAQAITGDQVRPCTEPSDQAALVGTYPLSRPLFMYVSNKSLKENPATRGFIDFILTHPELVSDVGYIQFEPGIYQQGLATLRATE